MAEILGLGPHEIPRDSFELANLIRERFWSHLDEELRPALDAQHRAALADYREIHRQEPDRYREELREGLDRQISRQLVDEQTGIQAVEVARDVIVRRLNSDPEVYRELIAQRPRHWLQRKPNGMAGKSARCSSAQ